MKAKRGLYLLLAAGLLGLAAGGGTFASFNAQTENAGNTFATGSLYLSNTVGAGTACFSYGGGSSNVNSNCNAIITAAPTGTAPGAAAVSGTVTVQNVGTINAQTLTLSSSACQSTPRSVVVDDVSFTGSNPTFTAPNGGTWTGDGVDQNMTVADTAGYVTDDTIASFSGTSITLTTAPTTTDSNDTLTFTAQTTTSGSGLCGVVAASIQGTLGTTTTCYYGANTGASAACTQLGDSSTTLLSGLSTASPISLGSLAAGASETFTVYLYLPSTAGNAVMDLESSFGLTWTAVQ